MNRRSHRTFLPAMMLAPVLAVILAGVPAGPATADEPLRRGDDLVFPEGSAIPRSLTGVEAGYLRDHPLGVATLGLAIPSGPIYCPPEYAPMEGLLIAWEGSTSWRNILAQMSAQITTIGDADVWVVLDYAGEQSSAEAMLSGAGTDMDRVRFVVRTTDTIWIRDYGPRYIYEGDCRAIVDHTYNRPRPNDNAFPSHFSTVRNHAYYEIPLIHGGGNYHLDTPGYGYTSRLINNENPDLTEQEIHDLWEVYQNLDTQFFTPFPQNIDSTQHIDMWMQLIADDAVMLSDWPMNAGSTQDNICDAAAVEFASRGYTVYRVPARKVNGIHYTYTNVIMCNDLVLVPTYTNSQVSPHNDEVLAAWQEALPDKTIVGLNCESIVSAAGVMHCIAMHVPAAIGGENPTAYLRNLRGGDVVEPGQQVDVLWISDDDIAVESVDLLLSTNGGLTFDIVIATDEIDDGDFIWTVPDLATAEARLRIVVRDADGNTGFDESEDDFTIDGSAGTPAILTGCDVTFGSTDNPPCDVENLDDDDDVDQVLRSQFGFSAFERNLTEITIDGDAGAASTLLAIRTRDSSDTPNVVAKVKAWNHQAGNVQEIGVYAVTFPGDDVSHAIPVASSDFLSNGGDVHVRLRYVAPATFTPLGFTVGLDRVRLMVE